MINVLLVSLIQYALLLGAFSLSWHAWQWYQEWKLLRAFRLLREVMPDVLAGLDSITEMQEERVIADFEDFKANNPLYFVYRYPSPSTVELYSDEGWVKLETDSAALPKIYSRKPDVYEDEPFCEMDGMQYVAKIDELEEMQDTLIRYEKWVEDNQS